MKADIKTGQGNYLDNGQYADSGWRFWLSWVLRLVLGAAFIYASWHKIVSPEDFARILYGYGIFPGVLINLLALWVPFIELFAGVCLITGGWGVLSKEAGLAVINLMLFCFILIITFNLIRGHEFDCGCFSFESGPSDGLKGAAVRLLIRDVVLLGGGIVLWQLFRQKSLSGHTDHPKS